MQRHNIRRLKLAMALNTQHPTTHDLMRAIANIEHNEAEEEKLNAVPAKYWR
jgi:hypothetical protein